MGLAPKNSDELWHVTDVPEKYLTAGMATIIVIEDESIGTMYHRCEIGDSGFLRPLRESAPGYVTMGETSIEGSIPTKKGLRHTIGFEKQIGPDSTNVYVFEAEDGRRIELGPGDTVSTLENRL